ncbi:helix-turn-helix domain-containing protein [Thioalkalivibrio sp. ALM2T]|uniref:helix-turn-helix domain-containing protein n=1 Tax=Thioalkalivibrio sp. ALM2T TaxID=1158184 RepID=UPI0003828920|nr:helix-turn-helix domain-containing protein [Thioalkalivibrio sp. ALM2T]
MTEFAQTGTPDWVSPPGETIADLLEEQGWSQRELGQRLDYSSKHVNQLIKGKVPLTEEAALRLERVLGGTARFWLEREAQYREALIRQQELETLKAQAGWLKELPLAEMVRLGWIRRFSHKGQQVAECLGFFGVASVDAWCEGYSAGNAAFRASPTFERKGAAVGAWFRQAERMAAEIECNSFDRKGFELALEHVRELTSETSPETFIPPLVEVCRKVGVAVVFVEAPKGCPVSGATRWVAPNKALIALSLRHRSNDHLWFSFFHEAAHLVLHGKRVAFVDTEGGLDGKEEQEANAFAEDHLIPPEAWQRLSRSGLSPDAVAEFARNVGVAPGIVVGRLQKEGLLHWKQMNNLKVRYTWDRETG